MSEDILLDDWSRADTAVLEACSADDDPHCAGYAADLSCADVGDIVSCPVDSVSHCCGKFAEMESVLGGGKIFLTVRELPNVPGWLTALYVGLACPVLLVRLSCPGKYI